MKKLLILSGKGGTGKTTLAAAFIRFSNAKAFADCDVDAPNLHIVSSMTTEPEKKDYYGAKKAVIDRQKCTSCGKCKEKCQFGAIVKENGQYKINQFACEGCGVCSLICPSNAVSLCEDVAGEISLYKENRVFCTAELRTGRGNSGKLVSSVKDTLRKNAHEANFAVIDGSPGIGCPVIASVSGVDMVLIVAEPTLSGISDLKRILSTVKAFDSKAVVCVNKADLNEEMTTKIQQYCEENYIAFVGTIPYDKQASVAMNSGKSIADIEGLARNAIRKIYDQVMLMMEE